MAVDKKELWVTLALAGVANFVMPESVEDEDGDGAEDLANEMADVACAFADEMLEEYERRFEKGGAGKRRRTKKKAVEDEEDD